MQDMQRRGQWGHIIHISSMAAHRVPSFSDAFYSATKHALKALAEGLRQEVRSTHLTSLSGWSQFHAGVLDPVTQLRQSLRIQSCHAQHGCHHDRSYLLL